MERQSLVLEPQQVHLWCASLTITAAQEKEFLTLLSADEIKRTQRLHFAIHRQRFTAARAMLRLILSDYLKIPAASIQFSYGEKGKPYLADSALQFNVSHSHEMAVYAFTLDDAIGVDIEKIESPFREGLVKRYFSDNEQAQLMALPAIEQVAAFYRIWARKEALLKATGQGLHIPLASFSVSLQDVESLSFQGKAHWHLQSFAAQSDYAAAFATLKTVKKISYYRWHNGHFLLEKQ